MAGARNIRSLRAAIAAIVLALAPAAHAVVYKWVEEDGKVIYSKEPPPDPGKVSELTRIDDLELVPEKPGSDNAVATPLSPREPVTLIPREPVTLLPRDPAAPSREAEAPPPRVFPRSTHTGAVQDPCLTSPDPRCHERNKANYHPFAGYSPGPAPQAVGASSSASAGGAVGGQVQVSAPAPKRSALPPASASVEWSKPVR